MKIDTSICELLAAIVGIETSILILLLWKLPNMIMRKRKKEREG